MQRRNFKMPSRNFQQSQPKGNSAAGGPNRGAGRWGSAPGTGKPITKKPAAVEPLPGGKVEDESRWQDDGGESGDR